VAAAILGLDLVAMTVALLFHRFYPDMQFWLDDRSPSALNMVLWAPHHVAGFICCGLATLLLVYATEVSGKERAVHAVLAGLCFAAALGTSTFITLLFAFSCLLLVLDAACRREWALVQAAAGATVVATAFAAPFLLAYLHTGMTDHARQPAASLLQAKLRYNAQASNLLFHFFQQAGAAHRHLLLRVLLIVGLLVGEFGFFLLVFGWQVRKDFLTGGRMSRRARVLWLLFAGTALPGFLLTSAGLQGNNDFGRHAGFCMRWVLILWAAPMIVRWWDSRTELTTDVPMWRSLAVRCAVLLAAVGLAGQAGQIVLTRVRFALTDANLLPRPVVEERVPRLAFRFGQIQRAMTIASQVTPPLAILQFNPHAHLHNVLMLYGERQMAASDDGCNAPFGGDPEQCTPQVALLVSLFGGLGPYYQGQSLVFAPKQIPYQAAAVTPVAFAHACGALHLHTVVASYLDPAWWHRESWIWQITPVYGNSTARVFLCPEATPARAVAGL
jgi:hypothetical protein